MARVIFWPGQSIIAAVTEEHLAHATIEGLSVRVDTDLDWQAFGSGIPFDPTIKARPVPPNGLHLGRL
jgi:hypothetical protein